MDPHFWRSVDSPYRKFRKPAPDSHWHGAWIWSRGLRRLRFDG
jgi:hypothetical protein